MMVQFHMCLEVWFSITSVVAILAGKWFFSCMNHNMSFHIGSDCSFYRSFIFLATKWTFKLKFATNGTMYFNWINLQNNQNNIFICKKKIIIFIALFKKGDVFLLSSMTIGEFSYVFEDLIFDCKKNHNIHTKMVSLLCVS